MPATIEDIVEVFRDVARAVERSGGGGSVDGGQIVRLDDVDREEGYGSPMTSKVHPSACSKPDILVHELKGDKYVEEVYGIDGSSLSLDTSRARIAVLSVAASYVDGGFVVATYPYDGVSAYLDMDGVIAAIGPPGLVNPRPIVALQPLVDPKAIASMGWCSRVPRRYCGIMASLGYGRGYDDADMRNENRILLETKCTKHISSRAPRKSMVLVDGPLYATPGLYARISRQPLDFKQVVRAYYALSHLANTVYRVEAVVEAMLRGVNVVGVVKRLSQSRLLVHAVSECGLNYWSRDIDLVDELTSRSRSPVTVVGPVYTVIGLKSVYTVVRDILEPGVLSFSAKVFRDDAPYKTLRDLENALDKYGIAGKKSYYILVKGFNKRIVVRVELPCNPTTCLDTTINGVGGWSVRGERDPKTVFQDDEELLATIVYYMVWPGPLQPAPVPIMAADRAASRISRSVLTIGYSLLADKVAVSYETLSLILG